MITKKTQHIALFSVLLLLVAAGLLAGLLYIITNAEAKFASTQADIRRAELYRNELSGLENLVAQTQEERAELHTYALSEEDVIEFLSLIEKTGVREGATLTTRSLEVVAGDTYDELKVAVLVGGSEGSVRRTLALLETLPYQSYIAGVTLSRGENEGVEVWTGSFDIRVTKLKSS